MTGAEAEKLTRIANALVGTGNSLLALAGNDILNIVKPYVSVLSDVEIGWLKQKNVIEAIKAYRKRMDMGLKDAKDAVEAEAKKLGLLPY